MADVVATQLDIHARLLQIAQKAVKQVADNQRPADSLFPDSPAQQPLPPLGSSR